MRITVRFFAILKDRAGVAQSDLDLPAAATVGDAIESIRIEFPCISTDLDRSAVAVNRAYCSLETVLTDDDELALIPPVSGG